MIKKNQYKKTKHLVISLILAIIVIIGVVFLLYQETIFGSTGAATLKKILNKATDATVFKQETSKTIDKLSEELITQGETPLYLEYPDIYENFINQPKSYGYIIELKKPSLIKKQEQLKNAQPRRDQNQINAELIRQTHVINVEHTRVKSALRRIANVGGGDIVEFTKTINAIAILKKITSKQLEQIKNLPQVKRISPNYEREIALYEGPVEINNQDDNQENILRDDNRRRLREIDDNNPYDWHLEITNVQDVWRQGYMGNGVTIAIIDSGIDSNHRDLRGKVIAEHCYGDCPNGRSEQHGEGAGMDDNGHGTHVAGIAAGNLFGVAPNASLVSIRAVNYRGTFFTSDVIRGIETAVDPNNDNNFEDHYDVISISLGGDRTPDAPDAIAVDSAVNLGVVVVIAAGNSGPGYGNINCPGCARKAITVGASDSQDNVARFSSRGPTSIGTIKPDVVAPGVNICSAQFDDITPELECYDDEHVAWQGTSMSTPLVAGAVALIKQAHPDWSPAEIKMALRNTGVDLNKDVLTQGYGRVDVLEAVSLENAPPVAELYTSGEIKGEINIQGIASENNFTLYYGEGRDPQQWIEIECREGMNDDSLCLFDTSYNQETEYILKLSVEGDNGQVSEDKTLININNIEITNPLDYDVLRPGDVIEINGTILNNFQNYEIEWGVGENPQEWFSEGTQLINNGTNREGILARFDTSLIDQDGLYSIRLSVNVDRDNSVYVYKTIYLDPTIKEGWPVDLSNYRGETSAGYTPTIENIDGGNDKEIIIKGSRHVFVFKSNGLLLNGWPQEIPDYAITSNGPLPPASVGDIDDDDENEIVVSHNTGAFGSRFAYAFNPDGSSVNGWPVRSLRHMETTSRFSPPILSNFDDDSGLETFIVSENHSVNIEGTPRIYGFNSDGSPLEGWPVDPEFLDNSIPIFSYSSLAVGDIDCDGDKEMVFQTERNDGRNRDSRVLYLYIISEDGEIENYFYVGQIEPDSKYLNIILSDINNDCNLEIIVPTTSTLYVFVYNGNEVNNFAFDDSKIRGVSIGKGFPTNSGYGIVITMSAYHNPPYIGRVYVLDEDGNVLEGWPKETNSLILTQPSLADINNDRNTEIFVLSQAGILYGWDNQGNNLEGFPKRLRQIDLSNSGVAIDDLDNDGNLEIIGVSSGLVRTNDDYETRYSAKIYVFELNTNNFGNLEWPMFQHDPQHTGLYKYLFSCNNERYLMNWRNYWGDIIRQELYDILTDGCDGFRCLSNNSEGSYEMSLICYNQRECNEVCRGSNTCLNISEWQGICNRRQPPQPPHCGNGIKEGREQCDGNDWGNVRSCGDLGYDGGRLRCVEPDEVRRVGRGLISCRFDTSRCY